MKRIGLLIVLLAASNCLAFAWAEEGASEPPAICQEAEAPLQSSQEKPDTVPLLLPPDRAIPVSSGIPDCPATQNCTGGHISCTGESPCQANGPYRDTDTGSSQCNRNGQTLVCVFGTIHVRVQACGYCPCCTAQPACVCPAQPSGCGTAIILVCK